MDVDAREKRHTNNHPGSIRESKLPHPNVNNFIHYDLE